MAACHACGVCVDLEHGLHRGALRHAQFAAFHLLALALRFFYSVFCRVGQMGACALAAGQGAVGHLAVTGVLMHAGYLGGVWAAVKVGMGAGLTALIVSLQPVLTAIWLSARGGYVSRRQWQGLTLGFVGLAMVVSRKLEGGIEVTPWSLTMITMALASITTGTLYQKRFVQACDVRSANAVQLMAAYVVTLPLALMETEPALWNAEMTWAMAWSVLALTLGGSSLFYMLIQRGAAASVTSLLYLVPPYHGGDGLVFV